MEDGTEPTKNNVKDGSSDIDSCKKLCDNNYICKAIEWYAATDRIPM
jgi:hypothetical protein